IRLLRKDFHISQLQLAKESGLGKSAISCWELGADTPNAKEIIILSRYFQVSVDYLLKVSEDNTPVYRSDYFDCDLTIFNKRLKELRIENNLSQSQLAKNVNLTQPAIYYWELGKRTPNAQAVVTLAKYFGVTTDYLLGESD
ncbi:MAG: helix-turn-helix domain-containing protein, partial [Clostridia bacterium]|nr:helix-turn-helix domain-containing protein [Clostridia bacterium]